MIKNLAVELKYYSFAVLRLLGVYVYDLVLLNFIQIFITKPAGLRRSTDIAVGAEGLGFSYLFNQSNRTKFLYRCDVSSEFETVLPSWR